MFEIVLNIPLEKNTFDEKIKIYCKNKLFFFQIIGEPERICVVNMYKAKIAKDPNLSIRKIRKIISDSLGIGQSTIYKIIKGYNETKLVTTPTQKRVRKSFRDSFDDFQRNTVREHVHSIWFKREIPTLDKIHQVVSADGCLPPISRTNLFHLLKEMDFHYTKRGRNSALVEKNKTVLWRRQYLENIKKYRDEGRHVYFLDETWVSPSDCTTRTWIDNKIKSQRETSLKGETTGSVSLMDKEKRLIVLNIGSVDGFVPNGLLCFESKKNSFDFHNEINEEIFHKWMESILPRLQPNSVIVMDNVSYHSVEVDKAPTSVSRKDEIIKWLEDKGEIVDKFMVIPELLQKVKRLKPLHKKYVIDELAKINNNIILRLPPYHYELNPIELAWSSVKNHMQMNNTTYKLPDVKQLLVESINRVDAEMWKNFINHSKKEEKKFYEIDFIIDDVLSPEATDLTMTIMKDLSDADSD